MTENAARVAFALPVRPQRRRSYANAYCPICGAEQLSRPRAEVASPEAGLCRGRCTSAWKALAILRARESGNEALATRRQLRSEAHQTQATSLSELLLERWRAGDWRIAPADLLEQLRTPR